MHTELFKIRGWREVKLEFALFGGIFPCFVASSWAWLPIHTSRICYNSTVSPTESSRISQGSRVYTLGHSTLDGESSKEGMGGAMPRWRPHPHPIYESSIVWWRLHSKFGDNHDFDFVSSPLALTHCQFDLGCRFVSFLYKRKAFPPLSGWILVVELL